MSGDTPLRRRRRAIKRARSIDNTSELANLLSADIDLDHVEGVEHVRDDLHGLSIVIVVIRRLDAKSFWQVGEKLHISAITLTFARVVDVILAN